MKLGPLVDWQAQVWPAWHAAATSMHPASHSGSESQAHADIWGRLPADCCWLRAEIEADDVAQLLLIGSQDWFDTFGSYWLQQAVVRYQADCAAGLGDDVWQHHSHLQGLQRSFHQHPAHSRQPLVLAAADSSGPFMLLDGNHRAMVLLVQQQLVGHPCYLGLHARMAQDFLWMQRALG